MKTSKQKTKRQIKEKELLKRRPRKKHLKMKMQQKMIRKGSWDRRLRQKIVR